MATDSQYDSLPNGFVPGVNAAAPAPPKLPGPPPNVGAVQPIPTAWTPPAAGPSSVGSSFRRANEWIGNVIKRWVLPEDETPVDPFGKLVAVTPPWLISLIIHFAMMIFLGLAVVGARTVITRTSRPLEIDLSQKPVEKDEIYAETLGEQLDDPTQKFTSEGLEPAKDAVAALTDRDLPEVEHPLVGPPVLDPSGATPNGTMPIGTVATPAIGLEFSGREEGVKKALVKAYGGTALTEGAVKEGLGWLARQQKSRGMWSLMGPYQNGANGENEEAATAMALLAFQGAGYTPDGNKNDNFTKTVARGWKFLLRSQSKDGHFFANLTTEQHQLYTQALCTIALCELYGMTRDEAYLDPAQKAIDYCVKIQAPEGGWRYEPGFDSDMSVTGWFSMALQSARIAGIEVPSPTFANLTKFLDMVQREGGSRYAYQQQAGATLTLSAEGLLCRQYLGWPHDDPRLRGGVEFILANLPDWEKRNVYYWYYATQVCHHMEGEDWQKWNEVMRQILPQHQEKRGQERGSWDPNGDRWGAAGGRLYVTCLSLYTLEVYYRHLPIYRQGVVRQ